MAADGSRKLDAKIVIIGNSGVGKTSLMERFVDGRFSSERVTTLGATFFSKEVFRGKQSIYLAIWDTAGCERQRSLMPNYYRNAKAAIVCFDLTDRISWQMLKTWVIELNEHVPNCKIIICGTKKDIIDEGKGSRDVPRSTIDLYTDSLQVPYIETSSRTGENVERLFSLVVDAVWDDAIKARTVPSSRYDLELIPKKTNAPYTRCC